MRGQEEHRLVNLLPGPVDIPQRVRRAFDRWPVSHRSEQFLADVDRIRRRLCELVNAHNVEILLGSGTLANDAVAAQLTARDASTLIVSNGEFGERLVDHARRFGLRHEVVEAPWGAPAPYGEIERRLSANPNLDWLWAVHCETSTGVVADIDDLTRIAGAHRVKLALDAVSSIGTIPVDLRRVHLATGVSTKGLNSYPGLAMVYHQGKIRPSPRLPRYLDIGTYAATDGIPFTQSSNLFYALDAALTLFEAEDGSLDPDRTLARTATLGRWLRNKLRSAGIPLLGKDQDTSPAVITIALPGNFDSLELGRRAEEAGFLLNYRSRYLVRRNLLQICLMSEHAPAELSMLTDVLVELCAPRDSHNTARTGVNAR